MNGTNKRKRENLKELKSKIKSVFEINDKANCLKKAK